MTTTPTASANSDTAEAGKKNPNVEHMRLKQRIMDAWTMFSGSHPKDPLGYQPWWIRCEWLNEIVVHTFRPEMWRWKMKKKEIKRILLGTYFIPKP